MALSLRKNRKKTENANERVHEWLKTSFYGADEPDCRTEKNKPLKKAKVLPWTVIGYPEIRRCIPLTYKFCLLIATDILKRPTSPSPNVEVKWCRRALKIGTEIINQ